MSTNTSLPEVQQGIFTALTNDATLTALLAGGDGVVDRIAATPKHPLVVIGDAIEVPDRTMGQAGHEVLADVVVYSKDGSTDRRGVGSKGFKTVLAIFDRITYLLVGDVSGVRTLTVSGFAVVDVEVDFAQTSRDTDGLTRLLDVRYRLLLEKTP